VQRFAGSAVENEDGFALIGNAEASQFGDFLEIAPDNFTNDGKDVSPDFLRIVFDQARTWINLFMIA